MRKVIKDYTNPPGELGADDRHNKRLIKIYKGGKNEPKTEKIYGTIYGESKIRKKLSFLYHNKCAYCESKDSEFEIEHYRPKKGIEGEIHDGYFWLCYEWSNLLPACHDCNKRRSKSTKFPIDGSRVDKPTIIKGQYQFTDHNLLSLGLLKERPLLIHPEEPDFDPFNYFKFDNTGWMEPSSVKSTVRYKRAKETIDNIIRLNRENLYLYQRKNDLLNYEKRLLCIFAKYFRNFKSAGNPIANDNLRDDFFEILKEIQEKKDPKNEFSFFWSYVYQNFYYFLPRGLKKRPKDRTRFLDLIVEFKENS